MFNINLEPLIQQITSFTQAQEKTNQLLLEIKELLTKN